MNEDKSIHPSTASSSCTQSSAGLSGSSHCGRKLERHWQAEPGEPGENHEKPADTGRPGNRTHDLLVVRRQCEPLHHSVALEHNTTDVLTNEVRKSKCVFIRQSELLTAWSSALLVRYLPPGFDLLEQSLSCSSAGLQVGNTEWRLNSRIQQIIQSQSLQHMHHNPKMKLPVTPMFRSY